MKIHIKNYQRLEDIELELLPGINLVSGSSNNGKSSTIRAVRDFIFNKVSKDKIRHGEDELTIELDTAKAIRNSKGIVYEIDNNKFEKVGRNILPEIKDKFNIDELTINGVAIKPNFWFQMDKPFLSDKTAGQKNDLLIGTKNDKYIKALKNIKAEQNDLTKISKKALEETIDTLKKRQLERKSKMKSFEGIEKLVNKINEFEKLNNEFEKNMNIYNLIKNDNNLIKENKEKILKLKNLNFEKVYIENEKYLKLKSEMNECYGIYKDIPDIEKRYKTSLEKYKKINEILKNKDKVYEEYKKFNELTNIFEELKDIFAIYDKSLSKTTILVTDLRDKIKELEDTVKEFNDFKEKLGKCPLCGGNL